MCTIERGGRERERAVLGGLKWGTGQLDLNGKPLENLTLSQENE